MGWGTFTERFTGMCRPNFIKLGEDIGRSLLHEKFVSELGYVAAFSNASSSELNNLRVMLKTMPNFALFDPPVKIRGRVGEKSIPVVEALTCNNCSAFMYSVFLTVF